MKQLAQSPELQWKRLTWDQLTQVSSPTIRWLWNGLIARGQITLLTSQWKCGKTTLIAGLLSRIGTDAANYAGRLVGRATAMVISEEAPDVWHQRSQYWKFGPHLEWICQPFPMGPTTELWHDLLARLLRDPLPDLVVIDTISTLLPMASENEASCVVAALTPLRQLTIRGCAVLLIHHPRKGKSEPGQAARGSGVFGGFPDIVIEMTWCDGPREQSRRRMLFGSSRFDETPRRWLIEWSADGTDYSGTAPPAEEGFADAWPILRDLLKDLSGNLTRREIRHRWPEDHPKPTEITLWRWLDRAVKDQLLIRDGAGRCKSPFKYRLPNQRRREPGELPPLEDFLY